MTGHLHEHEKARESKSERGWQRWCRNVHGDGDGDGNPFHHPPTLVLVLVFVLGFATTKGMEKQTAEALAKKGLAFIKSAAKSSVAAISQGVQQVRKGYATKHEGDVLAGLRTQGLHPAEHFHAALRKFNYLYLAGYKHELHAACQQAAKRLTDIERSTIPLEMILCIGAAVFDESLKYGDFQKGKLFQGLQDFLNKSRMGSNHFDRDALSHDVYYAALYLAEEYEGDLHALDKICREVVVHLVTTAPASDITAQPQQGDPNAEPMLKTAKSCFYFASALNAAAQEREEKRLRALREAEAMVQREQEKIAQSSQRSMSQMYPP